MEVLRFKFESTCRNSSVQVDGCVDHTVVAGKFADHFSRAYTSNSASRAEELKQEYAATRATYHGFPLTTSFDVEIVSHIVSSLKLGKAPDVENLTAAHLRHSHPILLCVLTKLFNLILRFGTIPLAFGYSYTVPVCKLQDSRTKAVTTVDFRGIAISPVISKTFEHCVLKKFGDYFRTHDNQFAFKKGCGCSHAIYAARNAIERLVNGGSTVSLCALRRTIKLITALFVKLMKRQIPIALLCVLENWLSNSWTCIKWYSMYSRFIKIEFGVRQGSVLAPSLLAVYIDDAVSRLSLSQRYFITG